MPLPIQSAANPTTFGIDGIMDEIEWLACGYEQTSDVLDCLQSIESRLSQLVEHYKIMRTVEGAFHASMVPNCGHRICRTEHACLYSTLGGK